VLAQPLAASELRVVDMLGRTVPARLLARQPGGFSYELSGLAPAQYQKTPLHWLG
jgi:hypothetical protein